MSQFRDIYPLLRPFKLAEDDNQESLMVKDPALSLLRLRSPLGQGFDPWPGDVLHAMGVAKNKINKQIKNKLKAYYQPQG